MESGALSIFPLFSLFFLFPIAIWFAAFFLGIAGTIFWIVMLVDLLKRDFKKENDKIVWVLILLFAQSIGALIYFFMVKSKDKKIKKQK